jgi:hypothetical protein
MHFPKLKETTKHLTPMNNMKINTKKCTPTKGGTPDSVMVHHNVATRLPPAAESKDEVCGRERKYLPTIIYARVMTSKRLQRYRPLSSNGIDELNQKLENLFVDEGSNEEEKLQPKEKEEESEDEHEKYPVSKKDEATSEEVTGVEPSSLVGRFQKVVFKSNTASKVSRSVVRLVCYGN